VIERSTWGGGGGGAERREPCDMMRHTKPSAWDTCAWRSMRLFVPLDLRSESLDGGNALWCAGRGKLRRPFALRDVTCNDRVVAQKKNIANYARSSWESGVKQQGNDKEEPSKEWILQPALVATWPRDNTRR
jgi:hypothetical protein